MTAQETRIERPSAIFTVILAVGATLPLAVILLSMLLNLEFGAADGFPFRPDAFTLECTCGGTMYCTPVSAERKYIYICDDCQMRKSPVKRGWRHGLWQSTAAAQ